MADIKLKVKADQLGKDLENLAPYVEEELNSAVGNLAQAAYASMIAQVQSMKMDPKNRQDYLRGLKYTKIDDYNYLIYLEGDWANKLEEGFPGYSIKDQLLQSKKTVSSGSRAGEPWVRMSKQGKRYAAVPFEQKPFSGEGGSGNLADDIKKLVVPNMEGKLQSITQVMKGLDGNALRGKVAVIDKHDNPALQGLTKFQHVSGSGRVSSLYMTFRMVSETSSGWQHPGFKGYGLFAEAEAFINQELDNIIATLIP